VRLEAVSALAAGDVKGAALAALEAVALQGDDPQARALTADALAARQPKRAAQLAEKLLPDRVSFNRLVGDLLGGDPVVQPALRDAAAKGHYQGISLPHLVAAADVQALADVAGNRQLPELTRLGGIEGLGRLTGDEAAAALRTIGADETESTPLRKAAWKALRRVKRARAAAGERRPEVKA
jgi:ParB family chromosome partitioning protein